METKTRDYLDAMENATGMIRAMLSLCGDSSGSKLAESWRVDDDSMNFCIGESRVWIEQLELVYRAAKRLDDAICEFGIENPAALADSVQSLHDALHGRSAQ